MNKVWSFVDKRDNVFFQILDFKDNYNNTVSNQSKNINNMPSYVNFAKLELDLIINNRGSYSMKNI